jgi:hypothetical protein
LENVVDDWVFEIILDEFLDGPEFEWQVLEHG